MKLNSRVILVSVLALIFGLSSFFSPITVYAVTPTVVQVIANSQTAPPYSVSQAFASPVTAGNYIVVVAELCCGAFGTLSVTDSQGNTFVELNSVSITSPANFIVSIWIATAGSSAADTVTFSTTTAVGAPILAIVDYEVSGVTSVGYIIHSGSSSGTTCGCTVSSLTIPANALVIAGMWSDAAGAGSVTGAAGFTVTQVNAGFGAGAEWTNSVSGANTLAMAYSNPVAGWVELGIVLNVALPGNFSFVNEFSLGLQPNNNNVGGSCAMNYTQAGNTIVVYVGAGGGGGQTFITPIDNLGDTYSLSLGSATSISGSSYAVFTTQTIANNFQLSVTENINSMGGHAAINVLCYQVVTPAQIAISGLPIQNNVGCQAVTSCSNILTTGAIAGTFFMNEGTDYLSGTGTNSCPTNFNEVGFSGNIGVGDSKASGSCNVDPGATSNKAIQLDSYGGASIHISPNGPGNSAYMGNLTTGNILSGTMFGTIIGIGSPITTTMTITGWQIPNFVNGTNTTNYWFFGMLALFIPIGLVDMIFLQDTSRIDKNVLAFLNLTALTFGAIMGAMLNFLPLALPFVVTIVFVVYLWKGRG